MTANRKVILARPIGRPPCFLLIAAMFVVSRCVYWMMGVRFDAAPAQFYWQIMDPALMRQALWQSLYYLRAQPPGFDLFIALISRIAPNHEQMAFQLAYWCMGLVLALALADLLDRLHVNRLLILAVATVTAVSPVTALYESWLLYEYPIAVLFVVSALYLHRYVSMGRSVDGLIFFTCLALLGSLRVVFHLVWFWATFGILLCARRQWKVRTAACAAVPGIALTAVYIKSLLLFGIFAPGSDVYGGVNLASIMKPYVPPAAVAALVARGELPPLMLTYDGYDFERPELVKLVPLPPPTGIPILDERLKSTGAVNMDGLWMAAMGARLQSGGMTLALRFPAAYARSVLGNFQRYFIPADLNWPFDGRTNTNREILSQPLRISHALLSGRRNAFTWFTTFVSLAFGCGQMFRWVRRSFRRSGGNARELTVAFVVTNILYLSAVVILYSNGDQNRYRFEVSTLYTVLFGLWVSAALKLPGLTKLIAKGSSGPLAADEAMPVGLDLKP